MILQEAPPIPGPVPVEPLGLVLAGGFVLLVVLLSHALQLGLLRTLLINTARCYGQLMLLGFALAWLFSWDHPLATGVVFGVMILFSAHTVWLRLREVPVATFRPVLGAVTLAGGLVTLVVTAVVLRLDPFWQARYWLPLGGMVLGNSITGIALAVERTFSELDRGRPQVLVLLALGATPGEAMRPAVRAGMRAGLMPIVNNMAAVGVVSIPGMMTGQVLAGADPAAAARYQIVVMLMIAGSTALGAMAAVFGTARKAFDAEGALREFEVRN